VSGIRNKGSDSRLGFVDDARGLAVVLMIFWHTVDGWIRQDLRTAHPDLYNLMVIFGGTAAPMFVMLAGVSASMKLEGDRARNKPTAVSVRELAARGLHVMATGYALRVYMWLVDDQAMTRLSAAPATIPTVIGLGALLVALDRVGEGKPRAVLAALAGLAVYSFGIFEAHQLEPWKAPYLLKVDVLQAIGASITIIALADPLLRATKFPIVALVVGCLLAAPTDWIATQLPGPLPPPIAAYLGRWDDPVLGRLAAFPLFPWVGYAFIGAAVGKLWLRASDASAADRIVLGVAAVGAGIAALANGPAVHEFVIPNTPFLYKSLFMLHKIGFGLSLVALVHLFGRITGWSPLRELGKTSMVIYWVHLEFAYGLCAKPLKHRLDYATWAVLFVALTLAMAIVARIRLNGPARLASWRANRAARDGRIA